MAARPNTARTLNYGVTLAETQRERLTRAVEMAEYALSTNKLLSAAEVTAYKTAITIANKQFTLFGKILELDIPRGLIPTTKRRPGRPSAKELAKIEAGRSGGKADLSSNTKAAKAAPKTTAKLPKPAKPAKAKATADSAPKRRGRPPKAKTETAVAEVAAPVKRRGRPPKAATAPAVATNSQANGASVHSVSLDS